MNKVIFLLVLLPITLLAQKEFPTVWESKFSVDPKWNAVNADLSLVMGGDMSELEMLDGNTGKQLWTLNFKDKWGVKNCEDWIYFTDEQAIKVMIQKGKKDPQEIYWLDDRTGEVIDASIIEKRGKEKRAKRDKTKVPRSTSKYIFQTSCFDEDSNTLITLGYDDKKMKNAWGGSDMKINVDASGGHSWSTSFEGKVVAHICANLLDEDIVLNVFTSHGKIFIVHEGLTVLDLKTGNLLWKTTFDYTDTDVGLKARQEIGRSAWPAVSDDAVYICDLTKGEKNIKKLDINTGKLIWEGAKLSKNDIISHISCEGGNLIVKYGGLIMKETYFSDTNGNESWKVFYEYEGTTSVKAYDMSNGSLKWSTDNLDNGDNFKKSPSNMVAEKGKLYSCSDKFLYCLDAATGKADWKVEYGAKEIGMVNYLYAMDGRFMLEGEKGVAAAALDGKKMYAVNTSKCLKTEIQGNAFIVWTGKDDDDRKEFIRMDSATGKVMGKLEGCYKPRWDETGDYFVRFDGSKVMKYKTNG